MANTVTQCTKIDLEFVQFYKKEPEETDKKLFEDIMYELRNQVRTAKNKLSSVIYFDIVKAKPMKQAEDGTELEGSKQGVCYKIGIENAPYLNSGNLSCITQGVWKLYSDKTRSSDMFCGREVALNYKANQPIKFHNKNIVFYQDDGEWFARLSVLSDGGAKAYGLKTGMMIFKMRLVDYNKPIVARCADGTYKLGCSDLTYAKRKHGNNSKHYCPYQLCLSYTMPIADLPPVSADVIVGVDLGYCKPFYAVLNSDNKYERGLYADCDEIARFSRQIKGKRKRMQHDAQFASPGSVGHGRAKRMSAIDRLKKKEQNFRDTKNSQYASAIINYAIKNGAGTIQMEDLSGISAGEKKATFLGDWTFYDLQQKIAQKCKRNGMNLNLIDPQYTSQRCSVCGFISPDNRKTQERFICQQCGYKANADYNAARNIGTKGIEKLIEAQRKLQGLPDMRRKKKKAEDAA